MHFGQKKKQNQIFVVDLPASLTKKHKTMKKSWWFCNEALLPNGRLDINLPNEKNTKTNKRDPKKIIILYITTKNHLDPLFLHKTDDNILNGRLSGHLSSECIQTANEEKTKRNSFSL